MTSKRTPILERIEILPLHSWLTSGLDRYFPWLHLHELSPSTVENELSGQVMQVPLSSLLLYVPVRQAE